ncbi:uracil-DNA glycosylase family protein [Rossellomorea sp. RS05]|uniref:uracil-DNA glycosylase family protein n=1 Tax=Rossellomorea sp. RS05 TaxID=3149166 RepID=UPI0032220866
MSIATYSKFTDYKVKIQSLTLPIEDFILDEAFLLKKDPKKKLEIFYAPFEYLNVKAKVVILGITPGSQQMENSYEVVWNLRETNFTDKRILHEVKKISNLEGATRKNLISMLDELNLPRYLGITSTSELFCSHNHLLHTTSVLPYPVFHNGKNYSGSTPNLVSTDLLRTYITQSFHRELDHLNSPLIIPLGVNVSEALSFLSDQKLIDTKHILDGFPHPSGRNIHRHQQFAKNKKSMVEKLVAYFK